MTLVAKNINDAVEFAKATDSRYDRFGECDTALGQEQCLYTYDSCFQVIDKIIISEELYNQTEHKNRI